MAATNDDMRVCVYQFWYLGEMSFVDIMEDDPNVDTTMKSIHNFQEHS